MTNTPSISPPHPIGFPINIPHFLPPFSSKEKLFRSTTMEFSKRVMTCAFTVVYMSCLVLLLWSNNGVVVVEASHQVFTEQQSVSAVNIGQKHRTAYHFQPTQHWINGNITILFFSSQICVEKVMLWCQCSSIRLHVWISYSMILGFVFELDQSQLSVKNVSPFFLILRHVLGLRIWHC